MTKYWVFSLFLGILLFVEPVHSVQVSARVGGFRPDSELFRDVYGDSIAEVGIEVSTPFCRCWEVWGNISYLCASGETEPLEDHTHLLLVPVSVGVNYTIPLDCCFEAYAGLGAVYTWIDEVCDWECPSIMGDNCSLGGVLKLGIRKRYECVLFGLYMDYRFQEVDRFEDSVDIGGISFGGMIGVRF